MSEPTKETRRGERASRRNFLRNLALAFTILPSAGRVWKASAKVIDPRTIPNPAYVNAEYEIIWIPFTPGTVVILDGFAATALIQDGAPTRESVLWHRRATPGCPGFDNPGLPSTDSPLSSL